MSVWPGSLDTRLPQIPGDADVFMFEEGQPQPQGHPTILVFTDWADPDRLARDNYDWSRMLAVLLDEPYTTDLQHANQNHNGSPCGDFRLTILQQTQTNIGKTQAKLKAIAPATRFWVNIHGTDELPWLKDSRCPAFNQAYVDVISLDYNPHPQVVNQTDYQWLIDHAGSPQQQLALVPGTYHGNGLSDAAAAGNLPSYFSYAESQNQNCNLGFATTGRTGNFDGCRVWIVAGWLGPDYVDSGPTYYYGELDADSSVQVRASWRGQAAKAIRPDLAHQLSRGQSLQAILPVLLKNN